MAQCPFDTLFAHLQLTAFFLRFEMQNWWISLHMYIVPKMMCLKMIFDKFKYLFAEEKWEISNQKNKWTCIVHNVRSISTDVKFLSSVLTKFQKILNELCKIVSIYHIIWILKHFFRLITTEKKNYSPRNKHRTFCSVLPFRKFSGTMTLFCCEFKSNDSTNVTFSARFSCRIQFIRRS